MSYQKRFEIIKKLIDKTFPDIEPQYSFNPITKHYEVCFNHSNGACVLSILEDSKWVNIKNIIEKNYMIFLNYMTYLNV